MAALVQNFEFPITNINTATLLFATSFAKPIDRARSSLIISPLVIASNKIHQRVMLIPANTKEHKQACHIILCDMKPEEKMDGIYIRTVTTLPAHVPVDIEGLLALKYHQRIQELSTTSSSFRRDYNNRSRIGKMFGNDALSTKNFASP